MTWSLPPSVSFLEIDVIVFLIAGPFFVFIVGEKPNEENRTVIEYYSDKLNAEKMTVRLTRYHRSNVLCFSLGKVFIIRISIVLFISVFPQVLQANSGRILLI